MLKLSSNKSMGLACFVKGGAEILKFPLTHNIIQSMKTGIVPDDFKSARVTNPISQKNNKNLKYEIIAQLVCYQQFQNY